MKKIAILGSTGSIGVNALNVVRSNPRQFQVVALAAGMNLDLLHNQIREFKPKLVAVQTEIAAEKLFRMFRSSDSPEIVYGKEGYCSVAAAGSAELVVSAMSGAAGLLPTLQAIEAGKVVALANKEVMVMAGDLVCQRVKENRGKILPIDSEHSAIFQCILGHSHRDIQDIILTASGGPFWRMSIQEMAYVTPDQALNHPKWNMGKKITIDSATMMNKGLEAIEARWLFDVDLDHIHIHIHPQSIVHSLIQYIDGSVMAQLGVPDMKVPIAYALSYPERIPNVGSSLDLPSMGALEFFTPDYDKFPNIKLAYEAGRKSGTMPTVLNAANEVAVQAFLDKRIKFTQISKVIEETLSLHCLKYKPSIDEILETDNWARVVSNELIARMM
jgi:1-deoxy-D-xylulose-5-phosphate reductoisomerase